MENTYCGQQEVESGYGYVCTLSGEHTEHRAMDTQGNVIKAWPVRKGPENYGTFWVCVDCLMHHANGECGSCHDDHGHDEEPLSAIEAPFHAVMGMAWGEHSCGREEATEDVEVPESTPLECDCETNTFSTSRCEGCNSYLHGERHAMTLFKD